MVNLVNVLVHCPVVHGPMRIEKDDLSKQNGDCQVCQGFEEARKFPDIHVALPVQAELTEVEAEVAARTDNQLIDEHPTHQALELGHIHGGVCLSLDLIPVHESRSPCQCHEHKDAAIDKDDRVAENCQPDGVEVKGVITSD